MSLGIFNIETQHHVSEQYYLRPQRSQSLHFEVLPLLALHFLYLPCLRISLLSGQPFYQKDQSHRHNTEFDLLLAGLRAKHADPVGQYLVT